MCAKVSKEINMKSSNEILINKEAERKGKIR